MVEVIFFLIKFIGNKYDNLCLCDKIIYQLYYTKFNLEQFGDLSNAEKINQSHNTNIYEEKKSQR